MNIIKDHITLNKCSINITGGRFVWQDNDDTFRERFYERDCISAGL